MYLVRGNSGDTVRWAQNALHLLRCYRTTIDGHFGAGTEEAVELFQEKYGLDVTGIIDTPTWNTITGEIAPIQKALRTHGFEPGHTSGICIDQTYQALLNFQEAKGLEVDGFVGPATQQALFRDSSTSGGDNAFPLERGDKGSNVTLLQYALTVLCCHPGPIDGSFGAQVLEAVKAYQTKYSMTVDGIVDAELWATIKTRIMVVQQALADKGYEFGAVDGIADEGFYEQLRSFQRDNDLEVDGQAGPATRTALGLAASTGTNDDLPMVRGSKGPRVLSLQYALWILGYDPNGFDSSFGGGCLSAVKAYQSDKGLSVDGSVGSGTWSALCADIKVIQMALINHGYDIGGDANGEATERTYLMIKEFQNNEGLAITGQVNDLTRSGLGISSNVYEGTTTAYVRQGSTGSIVRYLQQVLNSLGYSMEVDGRFGTGMDTAVKAYQTANGLEADGKFGPASWRKLFELYNPTASGTDAGKFLQIAQGQYEIGYAEDNSNNITPYGQWYDTSDSSWNGQAWCAMFVSFCARKAGVAGTTVPVFAYCPSGVSWYRERKRYYKRDSGYVPKPGDTIFFYSTDLGRVAHTGIVEAYDGTVVTTIEGNAADAIRRRYYNDSDAKIDGYGCNQATPEVETPEQAAVNALLLDKYRNILGIYGLNYFAEDIPANRTFVDTDNAKLFVSAGTETSSTSYPSERHTYVIDDGELALDGNLIKRYKANVEFYKDGAANEDANNNILAMIGNGSFAFKFSRSGGWVIVETICRMTYTNASGGENVFYVYVTHKILESKYGDVYTGTDRTLEEFWNLVDEKFAGDEIAELIFTLNRITMYRDYLDSEITLNAFAQSELDVFPTCIAEALRRGKLNALMECMGISEILETPENPEPPEVPFGVDGVFGAQYKVVELGYARAYIEGGTIVSEKSPTGFGFCFNIVNGAYADGDFTNLIQAYITSCSDPGVTLYLNRLLDLAVEVGVGNVYIFSEPGLVKSKVSYRYDFPEEKILPGSTGRLYYKVTLEVDHLAPSTALELVPVYSEEYLQFLEELEKRHKSLPNTDTWIWDRVDFVDVTNAWIYIVIFVFLLLFLGPRIFAYKLF